MKILHIIYTGINGGEVIHQKYLRWKRAIEVITKDDKYIPVFVGHNFLEKDRNSIYIQKNIREKFFLLKLIKRTFNELKKTIEKIKPDLVIIRLDLVSKEFIELAKKYDVVVEYPFLPLEFNLIDKPVYKKITVLYEPEIVKLSRGIIATLRIFKNYFIDKPLFIFPNSLLPELYKPKKFYLLMNELNLIFIASNYTINHFNGYDRLLKGIHNFYFKKIQNNIKTNIFILGNTTKDIFYDLLKFYKVYDLTKIPNVKFNFLGFKSITEINKFIDCIHLGINDLGVHRKVIPVNTSLKTVDFIGWNLPFILAFDDENLNSNEPFFLKFPANDTAIDFMKVIEFAKSITDDILKRERLFGKRISLYYRIPSLLKWLREIK